MAEIYIPKRIEHAGSYISFRSVTGQDMELLYSIFASTREYEMNLLPEWTPEMKTSFLTQQFFSQHHSYLNANPTANFLIVMKDTHDAGRLYLRQDPDRLHIIDVSILPAFRNQGIGSLLLDYVKNEAATDHKKVTIQVEKFNPAVQLYLRHGFVASDHGDSIYMTMTWSPLNHPA